jgi:hypothetical protein
LKAAGFDHLVAEAMLRQSLMVPNENINFDRNPTYGFGVLLGISQFAFSLASDQQYTISLMSCFSCLEAQ